MHLPKSEALKRAYTCGHLPWEMGLIDAQKLELDHPLAKQAWESWRESDANYSLLRLAEHGRAHALDDTWGPATERLVALKRCPLPDSVPPPGTEFAGLPEGSWERVLLESYRDAKAAQAEATGSGSWPTGCVDGHENEHAIRVNLDTSDAAQHWLDDLAVVTAASSKAYAEIGLRVIYVLDGLGKEAEIAKAFESIRGGVIGWNQFPRPDFCGQTISGRLDNDYRASAHMKSILEIHETGHGVLLEHTRGGIMNPSILDVAPTWRGDPHEDTLRRYFGGVPISDEPVDPPPPPTDPDSPAPALGPIRVLIGDQTYEFIAVPSDRFKL